MRDEKSDVARRSTTYTPEHVVAEHVSPPFSEEVKITLKVSQNLHASATPFLLGALTTKPGDAPNETGPAAAGFIRMRKFLESTGADVTGASQSDGAGADAHFTPDFMVHYLAFMAKQPTAAIFHDALPVLGTDGTLWNIQVKSPAAGHVYAKTGTYSSEDLLHEGVLVNGKGLAGYMTTVGWPSPRGRDLRQQRSAQGRCFRHARRWRRARRNCGGGVRRAADSMRMTPMVDLREPLDALIRQPRTYTSHLTFPDPASIILYDDTLRDGEQMPGVAFSPSQKVALAALLGEIGIDVIDVAFPVVSASDRTALQLVLEAQVDRLDPSGP